MELKTALLDTAMPADLAGQLAYQPTQQDMIRQLAASSSFELAPVAAAKIPFFSDIMTAGTEVFLPLLPGASLADTIPLAVRLAQDGMRPVPHLAARRLSGFSELDDTLARLRECADVRDVLIIAGDPGMPAGPFANSLDVLESGLLERHGIERAFVAGHPEPNPAIPSDVARDFLLMKNTFARETGIAVEIVTQFSFSARTILAWEREMRDAGNTLPIRVGLAGPTKPATLIKFAAMCGVRASAGFAAKSGLKLTKLASERAPDDVIAPLAEALVADPLSRITGLHLFTFGGFAKSAAWASAVAENRFQMKRNGSAFSVDLG
ncbi:MAG: metFprotein [Hyphomicrobiales bacterium]|nr:MAG: metFprotein [Hyphomicrobiales bacterium]